MQHWADTARYRVTRKKEKRKKRKIASRKAVSYALHVTLIKKNGKRKFEILKTNEAFLATCDWIKQHMFALKQLINALIHLF